METITIKRELVREALNQLRGAQQDSYVQSTQNIIDDLDVALRKPAVIESRVPHRCPICGGSGLVSGSFYTSLNGGGGTSANIAETCRSCDGSGVLWA